MALELTYLPRPDRVTKTGVIAPYPVRQYDPVYLARQTIWPFLQGIRGVGPTWVPQPEEIVAAATKVVDKAVSGFGAARVKVGGKRYTIRDGLPPRSPVEAQVQRCAYMIMRGQPFQVQSAGRCLQVTPDLARAAWARRQAYATGTIWDMIAARRRLYRMRKRPGAGQGPQVY